MKTLVFWMLVFITASISNAQNVNIPDANFKNALIEAGVDTSGDGEISYAEAKARTYLEVEEKNISNLTGVEAFINLETIYCDENQLTNLNISNNTALEKLNCGDNLLTSLDISNNTALTTLNCGHNQLTNLDVTNNSALTELRCSVNQLSSLNVTNNVDLIELNCNWNDLTSLDVSKNTNLTELTFHSNQLTSLNLSNNPNLKKLHCGNNQLSSLDVTYCTDLIDLNCGSNQLTNLDISKNTTLKFVYCEFNQLTNLDVSNNTKLGYLYLSDMPTLHEVCVWTIPFPPAGVDIEGEGSSNVCFEIDCNGVCENTEIEEYKKEVLSIFPNPSDDIINIEIENINNATIEIYSVSGRLASSKVINSKVERIEVSGFSKGIYLIKVRQENNVRVEKLIVY